MTMTQILTCRSAGWLAELAAEGGGLVAGAVGRTVGGVAQVEAEAEAKVMVVGAEGQVAGGAAKLSEYLGRETEAVEVL